MLYGGVVFYYMDANVLITQSNASMRVEMHAIVFYDILGGARVRRIRRHIVNYKECGKC